MGQEYEEENESAEECEENINLKCNEFKEEINRMKKYSMKALAFCSKLIGDLELAARYEVKSSIQELLDELKQSGHVLINFTNPELNSSYSTTPDSSTSSFDHLVAMDSSHQSSFMIFVPQDFSKEKLQIIRLLFIISEKDEFNTEGKVEREREQLLSTSMDSPSTKNLFYDTVFKKSGLSGASPPQPVQHPRLNSPFRRLSSSNSFVEMGNDIQVMSYVFMFAMFLIICKT